MRPNLDTTINGIILVNKKSHLVIGNDNLNTTIGEYIATSLLNCRESRFLTELQNSFDLLMKSKFKLKSETITISSTGKEMVLDWYGYEDPQYMFQLLKIRS